MAALQPQLLDPLQCLRRGKVRRYVEEIADVPVVGDFRLLCDKVGLHVARGEEKVDLGLFVAEYRCCL